jgi:hypothetical protein
MRCGTEQKTALVMHYSYRVKEFGYALWDRAREFSHALWDRARELSHALWDRTKEFDYALWYTSEELDYTLSARVLDPAVHYVAERRIWFCATAQQLIIHFGPGRRTCFSTMGQSSEFGHAQ